MNKSEIFKAAHRLAKTFEGDYQACFALALKTIYINLEAKKLNITSFKKWNNYGKVRIYFTTTGISRKGRNIEIDVQHFFDVIEGKFFTENPRAYKPESIDISLEVKTFIKKIA